MVPSVSDLLLLGLVSETLSHAVRHACGCCWLYEVLGFLCSIGEFGLDCVVVEWYGG